MFSDCIWANVKCTVTVVESGFFVYVYKQMAVLRNMRLPPYFYVKFAFRDISYNLGMEYDLLKLKGEKVTASMFAAVFCGYGSYGFASLRQTLRMAIRLQPSFIKGIRNIANEKILSLVKDNRLHNVLIVLKPLLVENGTKNNDLHRLRGLKGDD